MTRKCRRTVNDRTTWISFNGAASLMTRKCERYQAYAEAMFWLQWGRVVDDAEIYASGRLDHQVYLLQWGRVVDDAEIERYCVLA